MVEVHKKVISAAGKCQRYRCVQGPVLGHLPYPPYPPIRSAVPGKLAESRLPAPLRPETLPGGGGLDWLVRGTVLGSFSLQSCQTQRTLKSGSMAVPRYNPSACWTCRLRHKRCDESLPSCGPCVALEITCYYDAERPDWMDNGERQRQMGQVIKAEVKESAKRRRGIALMRNIAENLITSSDQAAIRISHHSPASRRRRSHSSSSSLLSSPSPRLPETTVGEDAPRDSQHGVDAGYAAPFDARRSAEEEAQSCWQTQRLGGRIAAADYRGLLGSSREAVEMGFLMGYMDYVFPIFYPFYKPDVVQGGRSWLPLLATKSVAFFSSISSFSSYFFSLVPVKVCSGHDACASDSWDELRKQSSMSLTNVQRDVQGLRARGVGDSLAASVQLLATILQILCLDLEISPSGDWKIHLHAAVELFLQIVQHHGGEGRLSSLSSAIKNIASSSPGQTPNFLKFELGAFQFYAKQLILQDIIASTALGESPRLIAYHDELQPCNATDCQSPLLDLEYITGCQPWVILMIAKIATIDAWKKTCLKSGQFAPQELHRRADGIEREWRENLERLDRSNPRLVEDLTLSSLEASLRPLEAVLQRSGCSYGLHSYPNEMHTIITKVWALAARSYLLTVISGWDPANPEIHSNVAETIGLLREISSPCWLRSLVWPLCVTGCLAIAEQRLALRAVFNSMGPLKVLGTARVAMTVMENVWDCRDLDAETWDMSACLGCLGYKTLLV